MVSGPWNIVGLIIAIVIGLISVSVLAGLLKVLVYRPARKPELENLPEVPVPKLLPHQEPEHSS